MSYVRGLDYKKRRPAIERVSIPDLLTKINTIIDDDNKVIARWKDQVDHFAAIAAELEAANRALADERDELTARVAALEAEVERLRRKLKPKQGTRREDFEE